MECHIDQREHKIKKYFLEHLHQIKSVIHLNLDIGDIEIKYQGKTILLIRKPWKI